MGVFLLNENKLDEMSQILDMKFVPTIHKQNVVSLPGGLVEIRFSKVLLGGDQLTVARIRGTQALTFHS